MKLSKKIIFPAIILAFISLFISVAMAASIEIIKLEMLDSDKENGDHAALWTITPLPLNFEPDKSSGGIKISFVNPKTEKAENLTELAWEKDKFKKTEEEATFAPFIIKSGTKTAAFALGLTDTGERAWYFSLADSFTNFPAALAGLDDGEYTFDVQLTVDGQTMEGSVKVKKEGKIWKVVSPPPSPAPPQEEKSFWEKIKDFFRKQESDADKALLEAERKAERLESVLKAEEAEEEAKKLEAAEKDKAEWEETLRKLRTLKELRKGIYWDPIKDVFYEFKDYRLKGRVPPSLVQEAGKKAGEALQESGVDRALREAEEEVKKLEAEEALREAEKEVEQLELKERLKLVGENVYEDPKNPGQFYGLKDGNFVLLPKPKTVIFEVPGTAKQESVWDKIKNFASKLLGRESSPRGKLIDLGENIFMDPETGLFYELQNGEYELRKQPAKSQFYAPGTEKIQKEIKVSELFLVPYYKIDVPSLSQSFLLSLTNDVSDLDPREKIYISLAKQQPRPSPGRPTLQQQTEIDNLKLIIESLQSEVDVLRQAPVPPPTPTPVPSAPTLTLLNDANVDNIFELSYNAPKKSVILREGINVIGEVVYQGIVEVSGSGKISLKLENGAVAEKLRIAGLGDGEAFYAHPYKAGGGGGAGGGDR